MTNFAESNPNTEIPIQSQEQISSKNYKQFFPIIGVILIIILMVVAFILYKLLSIRSTAIKNNAGVSQLVTNPKPSPQKTELKDSLIGTNIFFNEIPNFDNLELSNLPNLEDIRGIFDYQGNKIIIGVYRIILYDPIKNEVTKQNDKLSCLVTAALVEKFLYVGCNGDFLSIQPVVITPSTLYKVDMDTGQIVKSYFGNNQTNHKLTNIFLFADGNDLWGSSDDEVFKLDTKSEKFTFYTLNQLGFPQDCMVNALYKENTIKVSTSDSQYCIGGSVYNESVGTWKYYSTSISGEKFLHTRNLYENLQKKLVPPLPYYFIISPKINDKYYLFTEDTVYTLKRHEFPKIHIKLNRKIQKGYTYLAIVSRDEKYALLVGVASGPGLDTITENLQLILINLENGNTKNLMDNKKNLEAFNMKSSLDPQWSIFTEFSNGKLIEVEEGFAFQNKKDDKIIFTINTTTESVEIR